METIADPCPRCHHSARAHALGQIPGCSLGMSDPGCACCLGLEPAPTEGPLAFPTESECESLEFCFRIALEHNHGGATRLRRLLFAWHNAAELGGFDFADLWSLDDTYRAHALAVINMIARSPQGWYAEHYGYAADMAALVEQYGPIGVGDRVEGERGRDITMTGSVERIDDRKRVAHVVWDGGGRSECLTSELCRL